jgi:hypothetical protein
MLGPVRDGGVIVANTSRLLGPMITPEIRGGDEVTLPVAVEGRAVRRHCHPDPECHGDSRRRVGKRLRDLPDR